jgi:hypothetical protein
MVNNLPSEPAVHRTAPIDPARASELAENEPLKPEEHHPVCLFFLGTTYATLHSTQEVVKCFTLFSWTNPPAQALM